MKISAQDKAILRELAEKQAAIAALPIHQAKAKLWTELNGLRSKRPMVSIFQLPWNEMDVNDDLKLCCESKLCRQIENKMRMQQYMWNHLPADMIVEKTFLVDPVTTDSGFGISIEEDTIKGTGDVHSHDYKPQITCEADVAKIKDPVITYDREATAENLDTVRDIFGDILDVQPGGISTVWFAPWDMLVMWWGVQEALLDLVLRPELVHMAMDRLVSAYLARLDQWESLGLLIAGSGNWGVASNSTCVGSGGLGYTDELPQKDFNPSHVRPIDQWGCATAQIFSEVSPEMHEEFALQYEKRWLKKFGLTYYGCCEPLHNKMSILKTIPNLRKVSCSPWCKVDKMVEQVGTDYVISIKPNPAIFAEDNWNLEAARKLLENSLEKTRGCHVEIIAKDLSTMRGQPQRLWEWADMAMETVGKFSR